MSFHFVLSLVNLFLWLMLVFLNHLYNFATWLIALSLSDSLQSLLHSSPGHCLTHLTPPLDSPSSSRSRPSQLTHRYLYSLIFALGVFKLYLKLLHCSLLNIIIALSLLLALRRYEILKLQFTNSNGFRSPDYCQQQIWHCKQHLRFRCKRSSKCNEKRFSRCLPKVWDNQ